jgi:MFS transporter, DHA2 family, multidrug resistance protein
MSLSPSTVTPTPSKAGRREWTALAVLMLPVLLVSVDNTVLSFAVPAISQALRPSGTELLWIVDVYPLVLAGLLVSMGSLGDRIGRRRLLLIGSSGFAVVSVFAAFAPTAAALVSARALLGFFGAMLMPATLSLIRNIFTDPAQRRTAIAVWAAGFSGGAALGPIVGGFLLEHFWWGAVFLLAVPVLVPLLALAPRFIAESRDPAPGPIDLTSIVLSLLAMAPLVYGIKAFAKDGLTITAAAAVAAGLLFGLLFVGRQLARPVPMLDVRLFRNPVFSGAVTANLLSIFSMVGFLFFVSQHLQLVAGLTPMEAGLVLLPGLVLTVLSGFAVVRIVRHIRPAYVVAGGLALNAAGYATILLTGGASVGGLLAAFMILGAGVGASETISNDLILGSVPPAKAGAASAISETAYELGAVLGTAVLGSILTAAYRGAVVLPEGLGDAARQSAGETLGGAAEAAATLPADQGQALLESTRHAFDSGAMTTSAIGFILMLAAVALTLATLRRARTAA